LVVGAIGSRTEVAVIGGGPGGYVAALRAADAGLDVTLIERDRLGGTCLNVGCIPSKALIEVANIRHDAIAAASIGLRSRVHVDDPALARHLQAVTRRLRGGVRQLLADAGVTVVRGEASFARYDRLSIAAGDQVSHLEFDHAVLATGSRPVLLPGIDLSPTTVTSTGALAIEELPSSAVVIGAGYIGVEIGTAWAKLGVRVSLVDTASSILPGMAELLRRPVARRLETLGVDVHTSSRVVRRTPTGVDLESGDSIDADLVVITVGRRPNSDQASIDTIGIELTPGGHIVVDEWMRATTGVYAIGDLVDGPALAHKATAEAEVAVDAITGRIGPGRPTVVPAVVFSDPEIMSVGAGLEDGSGATHQVRRFPHTASARAQTIGEPAGGTYLVVDEAGTVLGVHAVGPHVSELAGEAALAVEMAATVEDLSLTVHPHPTMSESIAEAAWLARGHPLHIRR